MADQRIINGVVITDDTAYGASWDGETKVAPSKNAVYDKIETISSSGGATWLEVQVFS
jgi:hypothetical protein